MMVRGLGVSLSPDAGYVLMQSVLGSAVEVRRTADLELVLREFDTFATPYWLTNTAIAWRRKHPRGIFTREVGGPSQASRYGYLPKRGIKHFFLRHGHYAHLTTKGRIVVDGRRDVGPGDFIRVWIADGLVGFTNGASYHFSDGRSFKSPESPLKIRFVVNEGDLYVVFWSGTGLLGYVNEPEWSSLALPGGAAETDPALVVSPGVTWLVTVAFEPERNAGVALVRPFGSAFVHYRVPFPRFAHSWDVAYDADRRQLVFAVEGNYHTITISRVDLQGGEVEAT
jgi:hypothetical protein